MATISKPMPIRPKDTDPHKDKIEWLVRTHGFDARADRVIMLYEPSAYCGLRLKAFETEYAAWFELQPQQTGKPKKVLATSAWMMHPRRESIAGVRMRPDKNFPTYIEDGEVFKNIYRRPVHVDDGTGDIAPFEDFMHRFLPDAVQRDWQLDWLAHKWLHPEIPGTSPWHVANDTFGVGRGMFGKICAKLLGETYCKFEDFSIITGTSSQAVYTDWQAYSVLTIVDEAHTSPTAYRSGEKRSVYTALKNCIDPAPRRRTFKVKRLQAFDAMSFNSLMVFTNHINAAAIPANDRRISVLRNGRPMTKEEADKLDAWMNKPANIAALATYLEQTSDLSQFDMFRPLHTEEKDEMADLALNDVEHLLTDYAEDDERGLVFTKPALEREIDTHVNGDGERIGRRDTTWQGQLAGAFATFCTPVKLSSGRGKAKILISKRRYTLYCFRSRAAAADALNETGRREHAAKWGPIDDIQTVLRAVKNDTE